MDSNKQTYLSEAFLDRMKDMLKDDLTPSARPMNSPEPLGCE